MENKKEDHGIEGRVQGGTVPKLSERLRIQLSCQCLKDSF